MDLPRTAWLGFGGVQLDSERDVAKVSVICCTEDREAFMPWLLWNLERQLYRDFELILVDSSTVEMHGYFDFASFPMTYMQVSRGMTVGEKCNHALSLCDSKYVMWVGDDDWQHPLRVSRTVELLDTGYDVAGFNSAYYLDLWTERGRFADQGRLPRHSLCGFRTDVVRDVEFDLVPNGSDTRWMCEVLNLGVQARVDLSLPAASLWLVHGRNMSTFLSDTYPVPLDEMRDKVGLGAWGQTTFEISSLQERLRDIHASKTAQA